MSTGFSLPWIGVVGCRGAGGKATSTMTTKDAQHYSLLWCWWSACPHHGNAGHWSRACRATPSFQTRPKAWLLQTCSCLLLEQKDRAKRTMWLRSSDVLRDLMWVCVVMGSLWTWMGDLLMRNKILWMKFHLRSNWWWKWRITGPRYVLRHSRHQLERGWRPCHFLWAWFSSLLCKCNL